MKDSLLQIIHHYGISNQLKKLSEEIFELQEAIINCELKSTIEYEIPLTEIIGAKDHIAEEIADVMVMLEQFKLYYGISSEEITKIFWNKVDRQINRIEEEKKGV